MNNIDRGTFEMYWSYYRSIEDMLQLTNRYVAHVEKNKFAYSDEFAKIILLSCSEIDSLLKKLCECRNIEKRGNHYDMRAYAESLEPMKDTFFNSFCTNAGTMGYNSGIIVTPFENLDVNKKHAGLSWWDDYQKLKHNRLEHTEKGSLLNAATSIAAQYIIIRNLIDFLSKESGQEYVQKNNESVFWIPVI